MIQVPAALTVSVSPHFRNTSSSASYLTLFPSLLPLLLLLLHIFTFSFPAVCALSSSDSFHPSSSSSSTFNSIRSFTSSSNHSLSAAACATYTDCNSCAASSSTCHWCASDNACHAQLSPYGCAIGISCADLRQCKRDNSEFVEYSPPPVAKILLFVFVGIVTLVFVLTFVVSVYYWYDQRVKKRLASQHQQIDLTPFLSSSSSSNPSHSICSQRSEPLSLSRSPSAPKTTISITTRHADAREEIQRFEYDSSKVVAMKYGKDGRPMLELDAVAPTKRPLALSCFKALCCVLMLSIVVFIVLGVYLFPSLPQYSLCDRTVAWTSILKHMTSESTVAADIDLQFSIYNGNRFRIDVAEGRAKISYRQQVIADGVISDVKLPAGSVTDVVMKTNFHPGLTNAVSMYNQHLKGELLLDVDLYLSSSVWVFDHRVGGLNTSVSMEKIEADKVAEKKWCKCQD